MRNLIVCADGTWNTPDQKEDGIPIPTNVVRIFNAVATNDKSNNEQLCYYHPGVGTDGGLWGKMAGATVGVGLDKNIKSAYKWLCQNYKPGDHIFLFGFSRGAYTVRSLAGMIGKCGLLDLEGLKDDELWKRVKSAYNEGYRESKARKHWAKSWKFHTETQITCKHETKSSKEKMIPIYFLGVWDTVGALGIPNNFAILNLFDLKKYAFHDTKLGCNIMHALLMKNEQVIHLPSGAILKREKILNRSGFQVFTQMSAADTRIQGFQILHFSGWSKRQQRQASTSKKRCSSRSNLTARGFFTIQRRVFSSTS